MTDALLEAEQPADDGLLWSLQERIAELELALDDEGWQRLSFENQTEFSRQGLRKIAKYSRLSYLKNPLIQRAVNVQAHYTWAQGVEIHAVDDLVEQTIQRFFDDPGNQAALCGESTWEQVDADLAIEGNLFIALFANATTGHVRARVIDPDEIDDIVTNPEDASEPWFYVRSWQERKSTLSTDLVARKALYPHWRHSPQLKPTSIDGVEVRWNSPILHVRTGGLRAMRFGVPETYAALDWARAYKTFLEDWATLIKALSRFAWKVTTKPNKVAAAQQRLATTVSTDRAETNPPPAAGATFVRSPDVDIAPIPKTGATTSAEDGKQLRLMVAAAMNIPDTILSGDVDQGNLATSKTLDRPTELAFLSRQRRWKGVLRDLCWYVITSSVRATQGGLAGQVVVDADGIETVVLAGGADPTVEISFPSILEHDVAARIAAIATAATLDGKALAGTLPIDTVARLLLVELGTENVDELLEQLAVERDLAASAGIPDGLVEALREVREAIAA